jgi:hypothetical protein
LSVELLIVCSTLTDISGERPYLEAAVTSDRSVTVRQNIAEDVTFLWAGSHGRKIPKLMTCLGHCKQGTVKHVKVNVTN